MDKKLDEIKEIPVIPISTPILLGLIFMPFPSVSSHEYGIIKFPWGSTNVKVIRKGITIRIFNMVFSEQIIEFLGQNICLMFFTIVPSKL